MDIFEVEDLGLWYRPEQEEAEQGESAQPQALCSPQEALIASLNVCGRVDLSYMAKRSGRTETDLIETLRGKAIWQDPAAWEKDRQETAHWLTKEQYVRGNLPRLLQEARKMQEQYGRFAENTALLESILENLPRPEEIHVCLGATWVPPYYYGKFIQDKLQARERPKVSYNSFLGKWSISEVYGLNNVANRYTYGTPRMDAVRILERTMNAATVAVYDPQPDGKGRGVLNREETLAAQEKQKKLIQEFETWVQNDPETRERLLEVYYENYKYAMPAYDGSFLTLPDLNPQVTPYPHQKNAILRMVLSRQVLLAHDTGTGKTLIMCCGIHELLRMGLTEKAMIVVPASVFDATVKLYRSLYPGDAFLAVTSREFRPANRKAILDKIASGTWPLIFMSYASFDKITMSGACYLEKKEKAIADCSAALSRARQPKEKSELEQKLKKLKEEQKELRLRTWSETACFDRLGITALCVDEFHNYKNITLEYRMDNIVGMHAKGSRRSDEMLEKFHYLQKNGGRTIAATGTPLTNSLADLYVLQRYLQEEELSLCKIRRFDEWMNTFCEQETSFEVDVDVSGARLVTRFTHFNNLPELMGMFSSVCDFYYARKEELEVPKFGGYTDVVVKASREQKAYMQELSRRTEDIRLHVAKRKEDNLLRVTMDGRKCAQDIRLVDPSAAPAPGEGKLAACARKMAELYRRYPGTTQIGFLDLSTPGRGFHLYGELKKELQNQQIPEEEIAFIHDAKNDAQRSELLDAFNAGRIRILLGSTQKLGTGVNAQVRLLAVHHVDIPWRPSDLMQREGRLFRQGNGNKRGFVYRYLTEGTFDAYMLQILENKAKFISEFLSGSMSPKHRREEDISGLALTYAQIKALVIGNPLIRQRVEVSTQLQRLCLARKQRRKQLQQLSVLAAVLPEQIAQKQRQQKRLEADILQYQNEKETQSAEERRAFGEDLLEALSENEQREEARLFDWYQGMEILLPADMRREKPYVQLRTGSKNVFQIAMGDKASGCCQRLDYVLEQLPKRLEEIKKNCQEMNRQLQQASEELARGDFYEEEVEKTRQLLEEIDKALKDEKKEPSAG